MLCTGDHEIQLRMDSSKVKDVQAEHKEGTDIFKIIELIL
jgi:hypothetical protein